MSDAPRKPCRTWLPMALWTAGILLALGLAWFVGAVVVPVWQARAVLESSTHVYGLNDNFCFGDVTGVVDRLGGQEAAVPKLALYLCMPNAIAPYKRQAIGALGSCGPHGIPELLRLLDTDAHDIAICSLANTGDPRAVLPLVAALRSKDRDVRDGACSALQHRYQYLSEAAIAPLIDELGDEDSKVRGIAAGTLDVMFEDGRAVEPLVRAAIGHGNPRVREMAALLLWHHGHDRAAQAFQAALKDPDREVSSRATEALARIRRCDERAVSSAQEESAGEKRKGLNPPTAPERGR